MRRSVAVGVGGAGGWNALAWAVEQGHQSGGRLVLVHVCPPGSMLDRGDGEPTAAEVELTDPGLARAVTASRRKLGGRRVGLTIRSGDASSRLVEASSGADLLVVGAGGRTSRRVLRGAHCPTVIVRNTTPQPQESFAGMVVVGVDASAAGGAAVDFAFAFAQEHRLPLAAVHVLTHRERQPEAAVQRLADDVVARQRTYPDVPVVSTVLHGNVAAALIQAGAGAALLVVGDKRRGPLGRVRTGDVVVTVADKAPCPVAVVPADQRSGDPL